ncbi:CopG family transcriptional regulator [Nocardiopsis mangrovi]|uniref:CopG family transcriptional regulator n=1 Tax=Nocardiopsis mangrovi TaxID=1179818 RepID=A0ABV9DPA6_9ACTN
MSNAPSEATQDDTVVLPHDIAEKARARSGRSGLSDYVATVVARHIERENLDELIRTAEEDLGPITEEQIRAKREILMSARREQGTPGPTA